MPDHSTIHCMTTYMAWADDVMLTGAEQLSDADLIAPRDALFKNITGTFDHTLVVQEIFHAHLEGRDHVHHSRYRDVPLAFAEVARRLRKMNDHFVDVARCSTEVDLKEKISFTFVGGGEGVMTREEILMHLVNHSTYHRGFVSTLLYPLKVKVAANDLTVFLRDVWADM